MPSLLGVFEKFAQVVTDNWVTASYHISYLPNTKVNEISLGNDTGSVLLLKWLK